MRQVDLDFDALYPVFPYLPYVNKYQKSKKAIPKLIRFSTIENRLLLNQWSSQTAYHCVDSALQLKRGFFCFMLLLFLTQVPAADLEVSSCQRRDRNNTLLSYLLECRIILSKSVARLNCS